MIGKELIYSGNYSALESFYLRCFGVPINGLRIRARRILPLVGCAFKNILDAGCGPGVFTFEIAKRLPRARVTGIDLDGRLIEDNKKIAAKALLTNCAFEKKDIFLLEGGGDFDLVLSVDQLEHVENDALALEKFYGVLGERGQLILHVPALTRRWPFFGWKINFSVKGHCRPGYELEAIVRKVEAAGFKVIEAYYTYGWIETVTNNISYWITGAEMKNKFLYALVFPALNFVSYFGKNSRPKKGAGVLVVAQKGSLPS